MNAYKLMAAKPLSSIRLLHAILLTAAMTGVGFATPYTETYEVSPPGGFAALATSPYGVSYDFYPGRAFPRLAGYPIQVIGSGDEGFYYGNNSILPGPAYGEPGNQYAPDDQTGYVFNGYGTGETAYGNNPLAVLGFDFTNGPTTFYSAQFSYASGSNAPTHGVELIGLLNGVVQWTSSSPVIYGQTETVDGGSGLVDRIEIVRQQNIDPLFSQFPLAWYVMDNMSFDATGANGGYTWHAESTVTYFGQDSPTPEPASWASLAAGLIGVGLLRRRRVQGAG